jgi:hypothetical protein
VEDSSVFQIAPFQGSGDKDTGSFMAMPGFLAEIVRKTDSLLQQLHLPTLDAASRFSKPTQSTLATAATLVEEIVTNGVNDKLKEVGPNPRWAWSVASDRR